jgi:hypothetical protein
MKRGDFILKFRTLAIVQFNKKTLKNTVVLQLDLFPSSGEGVEDTLLSRHKHVTAVNGYVFYFYSILFIYFIILHFG